MVGRCSRRFERGRRPSRKFGSDRETLPEVRKRSETIQEVWNWSGVTPGGRKLVGTPTWRYRTGWETLPEFRNWSVDNSGSLEVVGKPSRRSERGQEILPEIWKCSGDPPEGKEVVGDPPGGVELVGRTSRKSGSVRKPYRSFGSGRGTLP